MVSILGFSVFLVIVKNSICWLTVGQQVFRGALLHNYHVPEFTGMVKEVVYRNERSKRRCDLVSHINNSYFMYAFSCFYQWLFRKSQILFMYYSCINPLPSLGIRFLSLFQNPCHLSLSKQRFLGRAAWCGRLLLWGRTQFSSCLVYCCRFFSVGTKLPLYIF